MNKRKRPAIRIGYNVHSPESVNYTVERYGAIKPETLKEIVDWLKEHPEEYTFEVGEEFTENLIGQRISHPIIKTIRKGSSFYKITDNEYDAQNTLENIRDKNWGK